MKELWEAMGYENLGLTSQNLIRDQAARLEKRTSDTSSSKTEDITTLNSRERSAKALYVEEILPFLKLQQP